MPKTAENRKTERILSIFHLLSYCDEVSFKEVFNYWGRVSKKTVYRDMCLLRQLGFQIEFDRKLKAFVMSQEKGEQRIPVTENQSRRRYIQKISRLIDMMRNMDSADDPAEWYRENYPNLSARTMQRDFKVLNSIGYVVGYMRGADEWEKHEPYKYYCEYPGSIY